MHDDTQLVAKRNLRINEFAKAYGIGRTKAYQEIRAGRLKIFKVGRITLISTESAEAWQANLSNVGAA